MFRLESMTLSYHYHTTQIYILNKIDCIAIKTISLIGGVEQYEKQQIA